MIAFSSHPSILLRTWRGGRVVEGARLESVYTATYRGFESLSLRQIAIPFQKICIIYNKNIDKK